MRDRVYPSLPRGTSVKQDWRAWLPQEKDQVFREYVRALESNYNMFSVSLNLAMELRQEGHLGKSLEAIGVSSGLCRRMTELLASMLHSLFDHAKHYGTIPNAAPLEPGNFRGQKGQRFARLSGLLNRVLLSHRLQFLHKVSTLGEMVEELGKEFREAADDLAGRTSANPGSMWKEADTNHYDLNTCLRETIVLLKSFLLVLPNDQLWAFQKTVRGQFEAREAEALSRQKVFRHRRIAAIAGE